MSDPIQNLGALVRQGRRRIVVQGGVGPLAPLVAAVVAEVEQSRSPAPPVVVLCRDEPRAQEIAEAIQGFWWPAPQSDEPLAPPPVLWMPAVDVSPYADLTPDAGALGARLALQFRWLQDLAPPVVVVSVSGLLRKVMPVDAFDARCELVVTGQALDREDFAAVLVEAGFVQMPVVEDPGTFTVRGGVVDFFPPVYRDPVRLELDGDRVESIRLYDPATQRTLRAVDHAYVHPVRETLVSPGARPRERLLALADQAHHPSSHTRFVLSQIEQGADFFGSHSLVPLFHERLVPLGDYLPETCCFVLEEPEALRAEAAQQFDALDLAYRERLAARQLAVRPEEMFLRPESLYAWLERAPQVSLVRVVEGGGSGAGRPTDRVAPAAQEEVAAQDVVVQEAAVQEASGQEASGQDAAGRAGPALVSLRAETHVALAHAVKRRRAEPGERVLEPVAQAVTEATRRGWGVVWMSPDRTAAARVGRLLSDYGLEATVASARQGYGLPWPISQALEGDEGREAGHPFEPGQAMESPVSPPGPPAAAVPSRPLAIRVGRVRAGFSLPGSRLLVLSEQELFGAKARRARRRAPGPGARLGDLSELQVGDLVVHELHGVGRYEGLRRETAGGVTGDFMLVTYRDDARLFLPVHRFGEVHRYVGAEGRHPRLDRLGGSTWQNRRRKVSQSVQQLAEELLQIYAERAARPGRAAAPPDELYRAFEATFPFIETEDQQRAIEAVLEDLMSPRPMDRLVCGDVGYGKTEVALRAAMLAVLDGRQVAVLAPTTVLVEQHLSTFTERMHPFPVRVEGLSRFRRRSEQQRVLADLAAGSVDVVIGTHRLLGRDVHFARLGLVIVDEEQRFGVAHKERLKRLRSEVDVLTLTATPIPRTLHMALLGLRDLSLIATPPQDRQAVRTWVAVSSPQSIREAIARELARGGQAYFVVPHIGTEATARARPGERSLHEWAEEVRRLVPEARVAEAHGQMDDRSLEQVMAEFVAGRHDVLVCTSIIESGLDIARANTLLVQEADRFGLAQLYQLRGRIGRGRQRAYCYFMVSSLSAITADARQRLEALQRFSGLGAGFHLASRDLEIRGTGDLLGGRQSGNIAQVGFAEYTRIMEEAVAALGGEPRREERDPDLVTDIPSFIPDEFMQEPAHRLSAYRRFAEVRTEGEAEALLEELRDRFGPLPKEVLLLSGLMVVKALARDLGARAVEVSGRRLVLLLDEQTRLDPDYVRDLVSPRRSPWRFTPDFRLRRELSAGGPAERLEEAKNCLRELQAGVTQGARNS